MMLRRDRAHPVHPALYGVPALLLLWVCSFGTIVGHAASDLRDPPGIVPADRDLADLAENLLDRSLPSLSPDPLIRRRIAQATFCLPQNVVGTAYYALLRLTGKIVHTAPRNEIVLVITRSPFAVSLGRYLFIGEAFLTEATLRHEYGHTLQGYLRGPFYLLFEGVTSFLQAALSTVLPSFAAGYYDRWPENEADVLGGVRD